MKEWIIDQLHINLVRTNQTGIVYHFSLKSWPMSLDDTKKLQEPKLCSPSELPSIADGLIWEFPNNKNCLIL